MGTSNPPTAQPFECYLGHRLEKDHYHVQRVAFAMPSRGVARQTVQCSTCGKKIRLRAASRSRVLWAVRIIFIVSGLILVLLGVALFFGSSDTPPNIGAGVGVMLAGLVVMALGFVLANFLVRREARGRFQVTMPRIRDSGVRQFLAVMVGNWALDLKHRLLVFKQPGANYTTLLPSERSRGARWIGDLVRNRVMSIEESADMPPRTGGATGAPIQRQGGDPQWRAMASVPPMPPVYAPPPAPPLPVPSVPAPPPPSVPVPLAFPPPPVSPQPLMPPQPPVQPLPYVIPQPFVPPQPAIPSQPYAPTQQPVPTPARGGGSHTRTIWFVAGSAICVVLIGTITVASLFPRIASFLPFATSATPTATASPTAAATATAGPIPTEGPTLVDPLKTDSGTWMTNAPQCQFTNGGYQVSSALCMSKLIESDGAISVDARIVQSPANAAEALTYGIMVRHAYVGVGGAYCKPTDGLEFAVDTHGYWGFIYTWCDSIAQYFYSGSGARVGPNQTNTLLVCSVADHFDFYVNGVHVGSDAEQVQLDGAVGLAAGDLTGNGPATVVFSNFAYYARCP